MLEYYIKKPPGSKAQVVQDIRVLTRNWLYLQRGLFLDADFGSHVYDFLVDGAYPAVFFF
jgi:hypothetical protein